jgi:DDE superfamily endonuclease
MDLFFGICIARMSSSINFMIHGMHALGVLYLANPEIFHWRMPYYAERMHNICGLTESVWGVIDGILHKTCHPIYFQKLVYSGHKGCHEIKFQFIVTPDGLFASMCGPVNGNQHDSFLLSTSGLLDKLQVLYQIYQVQLYSTSMVIQHMLNQSLSLEDTRTS